MFATYRNNEGFPPTSGALFIATVSGNKGLLLTCFSAGVFVIPFVYDNIDQ